MLLRVFLFDLRLSQRKWLRFESESWYSSFTFKQSGAISQLSCNFVPCHYHTNVCKISRLCKAMSSLSLKVSSLNLVSYCKLSLLSPGLSAGTVITKETKKANSRVLLGALLSVCNVSFVVRNLCLVNYRRNLYEPITGGGACKRKFKAPYFKTHFPAVSMDMRLMLYIKTWKQKNKNKTKDSPMFTIQDSFPYLFDLFCQTSSPFCSSIYRK